MARVAAATLLGGASGAVGRPLSAVMARTLAPGGLW